MMMMMMMIIGWRNKHKWMVAAAAAASGPRRRSLSGWGKGPSGQPTMMLAAAAQRIRNRHDDDDDDDDARPSLLFVVPSTGFLSLFAPQQTRSLARLTRPPAQPAQQLAMSTLAGNYHQHPNTIHHHNKTMLVVSIQNNYNGVGQRRWIHDNTKMNRPQAKRHRKIMEYGKKKEWPRILKLFQRERQDYHLQNLATTLSMLAWKIPRFTPHQQPGLYEIYRTTADRIDASAMIIDPPLYSDICRSMGKLQARHDDAAQRIINHLANVTFVRAFLDGSKKNPTYISNVAWSLARLYRPDLMTTLLSVMVENDNKSLDSLFTKTPEVPSNMIWACAKLNLPEAATTPLLKAIESRAAWLVFNGRPGEIDKTAWAFATLQYKSPALFEMIEKRSDWLAVQGDPAHVGHLAWAFATLDYPSPAFFAAVENYAARLVHTVDPRDIANLAWACATLHHPSPSFFAAIEKRATWFVHRGTPQDIANTAWAFRKLGHAAPFLWRDIGKQWDVLKSKGDQRAIESLEETFRKLGHAIPG